MRGSTLAPVRATPPPAASSVEWAMAARKSGDWKRSSQSRGARPRAGRSRQHSRVGSRARLSLLDAAGHRPCRHTPTGWCRPGSSKVLALRPCQNLGCAAQVFKEASARGERLDAVGCAGLAFRLASRRRAARVGDKSFRCTASRVFDSRRARLSSLRASSSSARISMIFMASSFYNGDSATVLNLPLGGGAVNLRAPAAVKLRSTMRAGTNWSSDWTRRSRRSKRSKACST